MFQRTFLYALTISVMAMAPVAFAGKTELTTFYPSAYGEYINLKSTADSYFATASGNVGIGTTAPTAKLSVAGLYSVNQVYNTDPVLLLCKSSGTRVVNEGVSLGFNSGTAFLYGAIKGAATNSAAEYGGYLSFFTTASSSAHYERMRIDENGNVGIGTTSPAAKLHVMNPSGSSSNSLYSTSDYVSSTSGSYLQMDFGAASGNTYSRLSAISNGGTVWNNLILQSGGGNVGIGLTAPTNKLHVVAPSGTTGIYGYTATSSSAAYGILGYGTSSYWGGLGRGDGYAFVGTGIVWATGAGSFNNSDGRLKENITTLSGNLEKIKKLRPVSYTWKSDSAAYLSTHDKPQLGLIAQEVKPVVPEAVILNPKPPLGALPNGKKFLDEKYPEGTYGVDYTKMVPILIGAVQEQQAEIELLKKEIAELKK